MTVRYAATQGALRPHYVYRLYDLEDRLLYIGATYSVKLRMEHHRYQTPWFSEVARVEAETFPTRRDAFTAEARAIYAESPLYNVRHKPGYVEPRRRKPAAA